MPVMDSSLLIKYAYDVIFGLPYSDASSQTVLQTGISKIVHWSLNRNLRMNSQKCYDIIFSLIKGCRYE